MLWDLLRFTTLDENDNNRLVILSAIDNLIKGGAGQAIQNLNIKFGFNIDEGLI